MLRFSYAAVPLGYVPSTGNALTGSSSPRPASIMPVTERTNSGAESGTGERMSCSDVSAARHLDGVERLERAVDGGVVPVDDLGAAAGVGVLDRLLDPRDGLVARQHPGEREEAGLEHRVRAAGQPRLARDARGVDREHLDAPGQHLLLHGERQRVPDLLRWVAGSRGGGSPRRRPGPAHRSSRAGRTGGSRRSSRPSRGTAPRSARRRSADARPSGSPTSWSRTRSSPGRRGRRRRGS